MPSGPISRNTDTSWAARAVTASANRTGSRACRGQYPGSGPVASSPVRAHAHGTRGAANSSPAATPASSSSTGSIRWLWNAWHTRSAFTRMPRARNRSETCSTASASPETTTEEGPLTAARDTPAMPLIASATSASGAAIAVIAPPAGSACISRARAATRRHASSSDSTPAAYAAVTSPTECPPPHPG